MGQVLNDWERGVLRRDVFYIFSGFFAINGLDLLVLPRIVIPLIYSLSIIPFYLLTSEITNEKTGILSSFLFAMCAESIRLIGDLYLNVFGIYFLIWSLFFTIKCINSSSKTRKPLFAFLTFFYLVLTSLTHQLCLLIYFIVLITYSLVAFFVQKKKSVGLQWLVYMMLPFCVAAVIYLAHYPSFLYYLMKPKPPVQAVLSLARLGNNWFFSVITNALALIGVYLSIKKRNLQYIFATSFLICIYVCWLLLGPVLGFWYFIVRIPERFYLFAFIPASALGGLALAHLISTKKLTNHWKYNILLLILCLSMSGYDLISVVHYDYFYPPPITARELKDTYWLKDNTTESPVITNLFMGSRYYWLTHILSPRTVYQTRNHLDFEYYNSILETYYLFISSSLPPGVKYSVVNNLSELNRLYCDGQVIIYARF